MGVVEEPGGGSFRGTRAPYYGFLQNQAESGNFLVRGKSDDRREGCTGHGSDKGVHFIQG